jgi:hypothetical protein
MKSRFGVTSLASAFSDGPQSIAMVRLASQEGVVGPYPKPPAFEILAFISFSALNSSKRPVNTPTSYITDACDLLRGNENRHMVIPPHQIEEHTAASRNNFLGY